MTFRPKGPGFPPEARYVEEAPLTCGLYKGVRLFRHSSPHPYDGLCMFVSLLSHLGVTAMSEGGK